MYTELSKLGVENKTIVVPKEWRKAKKYTPKKIKYILGKIDEYGPDALFFLKDPYVTKLLSHIKKAFPKIKTIMWYGDQRGNQVVPLIKERLPYLDALLITNDAKEQLKMYKKVGLRHVYTYYHSFSPEEFYCAPTPISHQVFFGGGNFNPRKFPLSRLRSKLVKQIERKFKLLVHGGGWWFPTEKRVLHDKYCSKIRRANVNLGINHYSIQRYYNRRLFESVGSGRLHITHYIPGMEKHFKNKEHLVWFHSIDQAVKQIEYYLKNPKEREEIAAKGRKFFVKHHSWGPRAKQFKAILGKIL